MVLKYFIEDNFFAKKKIDFLFSMKAAMLYFTILIFFAPLSIVAQNDIKGKVIRNNNTPCEFATVNLLTDGKILKSVVSDSIGEYKFSNLNQGNYQIQISLIGYNKFDTTFFVDKNVHFQTEISIDKRQLKEVTVISKKPIIERKIDRLVFNTENLITAGLTSLDLIARTPLIKVRDESINITGKSEVGVMINDKLSYMSGTTLMEYLKSIPVESIVKIEVITNPSSKYDAAGSSGLINIVTKRIKKIGYFGTANFGMVYNGNTVVRPSLSLNYNQKKVQFFLNLSYGKGANISTYTNSISYPQYLWDSKSSDKEFSNVKVGSFGFEISLSPNTSIGMSYNKMDSRPDKTIERITNIFNKQTLLLDSIISNPSNDDKLFNDQSINIHFTHKFDSIGRKVTIDGDWYDNKYTLQSDIYKYSFYANGQTIPNTTASNLSNKYHEAEVYSLNCVFDIPLKKSSLVLGAKTTFFKNINNVTFYDRVNNQLILNPNNSNAFKVNENIQALFTEYNFSHKKFEFQFGLRGEFTQTKGFSQTLQQVRNTSYFNIFPTAYINYTVNDNNSITLNFGKRIKRPSFSALNPFKLYYDYYTYIEGNPSLSPYFSNNFELTHTYKNFIVTTIMYSKEKDAVYYLTLPQAGTNNVKIQPSNSITTSYFLYDVSVIYPRLKWWESSNEVSVFYNDVSSKLSQTPLKIFGWGSEIRSANSFFFNKTKTLSSGLDLIYQFPSISLLSNNKAIAYTDITFRALVYKKRLQLNLSLRDVFKSKTTKWSQEVNGINTVGSVNNGTRRLGLTLRYSFGNNKIKKNSAHTGLEGESGRVN